MFAPNIETRVIQADEARGTTDDGAWVGSFCDVASQAGQSKIPGICRAFLFPADDVIDME